MYCQECFPGGCTQVQTEEFQFLEPPRAMNWFTESKVPGIGDNTVVLTK